MRALNKIKENAFVQQSIDIVILDKVEYPVTGDTIK